MAHRFLTRYCPACGRYVKTKQRPEGEVYFRHDLDLYLQSIGEGDRCMNSEESIDRPYVVNERNVYVRHEGRVERP